MAAKNADLPLMKLLVQLGADPMTTNVDGTNALMAAAGIGVVAVGEEPGTEPEVLAAAAYLLDFGFDINHKDDNGETAMHGAAYRLYPRVVEFLGLEPAELSSPLVKLNPDDLSQVVENFDEVQACLAQTRFAWCLA